MRHDPLPQEARRDRSHVAWGEITGWLQEASCLHRVQGRVIHILTLEGVMTAGIGDWIIRGVRGEFYPCKPDIFEATYEAVEA